jgi:hypothetical protein
MQTKLLGGTASPSAVGIAPLEVEMVKLKSFMKMYDLRPTMTYSLIKQRKLSTVKIGRSRYVLLSSARRLFADLEHTGPHREEAA